MSKRLRIPKRLQGLDAFIPEETRQKHLKAAATWIEEEEAGGRLTASTRGKVMQELREAKNQIYRYSKIVAARETMTLAHAEMDPLIDTYNAWVNRPTEERLCKEYHQLLGKLVVLANRFREASLLADLDKKEIDAAQEVLETLSDLEILFRDLGKYLQEEERQKRMESRAEPEVVINKILCKRCLKKEAKLEGFCKKCARAEGIIVRGKIT